MGFLTAYFIIAMSCILITGRTLIAYADTSVWVKSVVYMLFAAAWFCPILIWSLQPRNVLPVSLYTLIAKGGYILFGFSFILVMLLVVRDALWGGAYLLSGRRIINPSDTNALRIANYFTLGIAVLLSGYAVYAAEKLPRVLHYEYTDSRIQKPVKVLLASDIHLNKMMSVNKVKRLVKHLNALKADMILLPGDITDDRADDISAQVKELGKLQAPLGVYYTLGNHETYFDGFRWEAEMASLGWHVLHNSGEAVEGTGIYVAGIPDFRAFATNIKQSVRQAEENHYRILLSHQPVLVDKIEEGRVNMQVSGHTHGGQIFPFNFAAKWGNGGYLFGEYLVNQVKLLVSRGVGYWGPPMRLFAPNDVMIIDLKPENQNS